MRTPLLLGANPRIAKTSAWVPVRFDNWKVVVEGLIDTVLDLHHHDPEVSTEFVKQGPVNGEVIPGPCNVRVLIKKPGTERIISVFAEEIV